jgi:hypothetical protein
MPSFWYQKVIDLYLLISVQLSFCLWRFVVRPVCLRPTLYKGLLNMYDLSLSYKPAFKSEMCSINFCGNNFFKQER